MQIFTNTHYDFIKWRWHAIALSALVILAGVGMVVATRAAARHRLLGRHHRRLQVREAGRRGRRPQGASQRCRARRSSSSTASPSENQVLIRLPQPPGVEAGLQPRDRTPSALNDAVQGGQPRAVRGDQPRGRRPGDRQGPAAQGPLRDARLDPRHHRLHRAAVPLHASRVGAIAATFHDILVTLAFLVFFGYDLSLNVIAALLTITGYSVNDTIVIFDRVRENMHTMRRDDAREGRQRRASTRRWAARSSPPARRSSRCWRCTCSAARCSRASPSRCSSASSAAPTRRSSSPRRSPSC